MKVVLSLLLVLTLASCGSTPQTPISYSQNYFEDKTPKIGVYLDELPKADTHLPGASCLLCLAAAAAANSSLTKHFKTIASSSNELKDITPNVLKLLHTKSVEAKAITSSINIDKLPKFKTKELNFAKKDFRKLRETLGIDKLIIIDLNTIGAVRSYSGYIPNGAPTGSVLGLIYTVDLKTNKLELYQPIQNNVAVQGEWDEPRNFPGVTNAYYQAIEQTKDQVTEIFE